MPNNEWLRSLRRSNSCIIFYIVITDNNSSSATEAEYCKVTDVDQTTLISNGTDSADSCDDPIHTSSVYPALYFFVFAQLLISFGGCGINVLTCPYIDENAPKTKSALYLGTSTFCQFSL